MFTMETTCRSLLSIALLVFGLSCCDSKQPSQAVNSKTNTAKNASTENTNANDDPKGEYLKSETGTPMATPKPGTSNIQGTVFFNSSPAEDIEVKLCVDSANLFGDCIGKKLIAKTDKNGHYLFADLEPRVYNALYVRVFKSREYVHTAKYGFLSLKIRTQPDKTFFVPLTMLFKSDLKVLHPKANAAADGQDLEISWDAYPDAASYSIELFQFGNPGVDHLRGVSPPERREHTRHQL